MRNYTISIGKNRLDKRWKQKTVTWEELTKKLSHTHRTAETEAEYHISDKDRRAEIKDVGGFVGGVIEGGRRVKGSVKSRSLLTLDIDEGTGNVWDEITLSFDCACCIYSTHSHTRKKPRLRLVIPLNRDVNGDEYEALGRAVAKIVGIDMFDDSTYQPERLMFWPSTPKDGEYIYQSQEGNPMDVDAELKGFYRDWRDSSQWPVSSRQSEIIRSAVKQAGDPLTKPGIVGRFCRSYTIQDAIAQYLSDEYVPVANDPNRYTYLKGSTSGGLVIYDNKFAYSHHGTDPTGGQLCNAFDLVRIHMFGGLDEKSLSREVTKRPSYLQMEDLVNSDEAVKALDLAETKEKLREDFGDLGNTDTIFELLEEEAGGDTADKPDRPRETASNNLDDTADRFAWVSELERTRDGKIKNTIGNVITVLEEAQGLKDNLRRNEMLRADVIIEDLPWRPARDKAKGKFWSNDDDAQLMVWLEIHFGLTGKEKILNAKTDIACRHTYHPVRQYLRGLEWDGTKRVENIFVDYLGAADTELTRAVARKSLTAAVARVMKPGCKFDYITVLQGPEGLGKSTLLNTLGGEWFSDSITDLSGKEGMEQIQGAWIIEAAELQGVKRNEVEEVKAFISRQEDVFRPAYGRTKERCPRQCVFFSTTNEASFLRGNTGNRRFWIVACGEQEPTKDVWHIDPLTRDQIWAEAVTLYTGGEKLYLDRHQEASMRQQQVEYNEIANDPRIGMIEAYLDKKLPVDWGGYDIGERKLYLADSDIQEKKGINRHDRTCAAEILTECFGIKMDDTAKFKVKEINALMDKISGWEKSANGMRFPLYGLQRGFVRMNRSIYNDDDDL